MSILIRGMEMPDNCTDCWFRKMARHEYLADCILCPFTGDTTPYLARGKKCPLVPIPPHGDLIDRDKFRNTVFIGEQCLYSWDELEDAIDYAPTIIPASEDAKTEEDTEPWLCLSCRHYPPSSTDGKPCSQCNPSEVWHSCYDPAEEGE